MSSRREYGLIYAYEAHYVFMEVSNGIYKVLKDRSNAFQNRQYVTADTVVTWMNAQNSKVAICRDELRNIVHTNFDREEVQPTMDIQGTTNAEWRGVLGDA